MEAGAKRVVVTEPAFTVLTYNELAVCEAQTVKFWRI
jgi:hypothetical protein